MNQIAIDSRERFGNLVTLVLSRFGSFFVHSFSVYQILYLTDSGYKQKQQCFLYAGCLCVCVGFVAIYNVFMWYKYNSSTPERSCIYENLGVVGIATLFLLIVYLWLRVYPNERLKLASDLFPSGSVVEFLRVHGVYVIQLTMVMATVLGWATIEAEVFTSVDTTGKIHGLLFLTKFLSPVPLIVQYHPEYDIQDGILVLALLNAFCVILLTLLLHSKAQSASRISLKPIPPRSRRRNKCRKRSTAQDEVR